MADYEVTLIGDKVIAKNVNSGLAKEFTIYGDNCEINGYREYLVDDKEHLRVRLFNRTPAGLQDAVTRYAEGYLDNRLYRHPM